MKIAILFFQDRTKAAKWQKACVARKIEHQLFDLAASDWMESIRSYEPDLILLRSPGDIERNKAAFDERVYVLSTYLGFKVFPSYTEIVIYENKKMLSYFLQAKEIPHPETRVFYDKQEALAFVASIRRPLVMKTSIGASGSGVVVCKTRSEAKKYIDRTFSHKGAPVKIGPNRITGSLRKWIKKALADPKYAKKRVGEYAKIAKSPQRNFVICQQYIEHSFEWRVAKIGESYFAHKKHKVGDKCSGTKGIDYVNPPLRILDFVREMCEKNDLHSVAVDIFEHNKGYVVNEIQTIFGHVQDHILEVDGKVGRYLYQDGAWIFEEGTFNTNESYDLRLDVALKLHGFS